MRGKRCAVQNQGITLNVESRREKKIIKKGFSVIPGTIKANL